MEPDAKQKPLKEQLHEKFKHERTMNAISSPQGIK